MELKQILEVVGYEGKPEELTEEKLRAHMMHSFVGKSVAHEIPEIQERITGTFFRKFNTRLKQTFGLTESEIEGKKVEDILDYTKNKYQTELDALREAGKSGKDKQVADLMKQLEEKDKSMNDYKTKLEQTAQEYENFKKQSDDTIREAQIRFHLKDFKGKIPFIDGITEVQRTGFDALISNKYQFDLENDQLVVKTKDGHRIDSKRGAAGKFADPLEIFEIEAAQNGLLKKNSTEKKVITFAPQNQNGVPSRVVRERVR